MNFEDEPYVRLFTRRTLNNRLLGWEGRAVMHEMLYEFDRAGVFEFRGELEEAIVVMTQLPTKTVKVGLSRILKAATWVVRGSYLVWPNFLLAQTCTRSDAARQKESRERRRAAAHASEVLGADAPQAPVTSCDIPSQDVTNESRAVTGGHDESQVVTLILSEPSLSEPSLPPDARAGGEPVVAPRPADVATKAAEYVRDSNKATFVYGPADTWPEVIAAFADFGEVWPKSGQLRSRDKRAVTIIERLAEGITLDELSRAARGAKLDPHIAGNAGFQTVQTIWRDPGQVDRFCRLLESPPTPQRKGGTPIQPSYGVKADMEVTET